MESVAYAETFMKNIKVYTINSQWAKSTKNHCGGVYF